MFCNILVCKCCSFKFIVTNLDRNFLIVKYKRLKKIFFIFSFFKKITFIFENYFSKNYKYKKDYILLI